MKDHFIVLILDDDPYVISEVSAYFGNNGIAVEGFVTAELAVKFLDSPEGKKVDFVIVDLFLDGDQGDALSNNFVRDVLINRKIRYCRLTSAPRLVPKDLGGIKILDKRDVLRNPSVLLDLVLAG